MPTALYLFCLARGGRVPTLAGTGISGHEILVTKDFFGVTAVVCEVAQDDFAGPSAETQLQDLGWVGPRAVRHEQVIEEVMGYSPVFPARFGALFYSAESLARLVELNLELINGFLDEVTDNEEWSVKGSVSKTKAVAEIFSDKLKSAAGGLSSLPPGIRYFKERQIRAEADKQLTSWVRKACNAVADELVAYSTKSRQRKVISLPKEEGEREAVVNWAFLVNSSRVREFVNLVNDANARRSAGGLFFECSGPWPPYSFCPSLRMESVA